MKYYLFLDDYKSKLLELQFWGQKQSLSKKTPKKYTEIKERTVLKDYKEKRG